MVTKGQLADLRTNVKDGDHSWDPATITVLLDHITELEAKVEDLEALKAELLVAITLWGQGKRGAAVTLVRIQEELLAANERKDSPDPQQIPYEQVKQTSLEEIGVRWGNNLMNLIPQTLDYADQQNVLSCVCNAILEATGPLQNRVTELEKENEELRKSKKDLLKVNEPVTGEPNAWP